MCNLWIYPWEINKDKLRDHTDVQSLNLTASKEIFIRHISVGLDISFVKVEIISLVMRDGSN